MSETANFSYDGNVALKIGGKMPKIEVLSIDHLIPVNVKAKVNGVETVASAFIDYTAGAVYVPESELVHVINEDIFKAAVIQFLQDREDREIAEQEAAEQEAAQENYRMAKAAQENAIARAERASAEASQVDDDDE